MLKKLQTKNRKLKRENSEFIRMLKGKNFYVNRRENTHWNDTIDHNPIRRYCLSAVLVVFFSNGRALQNIRLFL